MIGGGNWIISCLSTLLTKQSKGLIPKEIVSTVLRYISRIQIVNKIVNLAISKLVKVP